MIINKRKDCKKMAKEFHVVFFSSRNKDNTMAKDFKQRMRTFVTDKTVDELKNDFNSFVDKGQVGELSRFYYSINSTNLELANRDLIHYLVDRPLATPSQIKNKLVSVSALNKNLNTHKWLLDCDFQDEEKLQQAVQRLTELSKDEDIVEKIGKTIHGYFIITKHDFDTRKFLKEFPEIANKKNGNELVAWKIK